jgi:YebC/PmpR family DNA-binding regulatory protein
MSGHSHWAGIKQRKGVNDAKRAGVFTKLAKLVTIAAREGGGGNPDTNFRLRLAIDQARYANMPKDNIDRAIKRGTGELKDGTEIVEVLYEGYFPVKQSGVTDNVAILIKALTDNRNRTVSEIKSLFTKNGGKFATTGSVAFLFQSVGEIIASKPAGIDQDSAELALIDAGAEDFEILDENTFALYTTLESLQTVTATLDADGFTIQASSLSYRPLQALSPDADSRITYQAFREKLEEHDDVQTVYDNTAE